MDTKKSLFVLLENNWKQRETNITQIINKSNANGVKHVNDPMRFHQNVSRWKRNMNREKANRRQLKALNLNATITEWVFLCPFLARDVGQSKKCIHFRTKSLCPIIMPHASMSAIVVDKKSINGCYDFRSALVIFPIGVTQYWISKGYVAHASIGHSKGAIALLFPL